MVSGRRTTLRYADWLARIQKGSVEAGYLFCGPETLLRDQAIRELQLQLSPQPDKPLAIDRFHGGDCSLAQVALAFSTVGLFSPARFVTLSSAERSGRAGKKDRDALFTTLMTAPPGSHFVAMSDLTVRELERKNQWTKRLASDLTVVEFAHPRPAEALRWMLGESSRLGVKLTPGAAELLVEKVGTHLQELARELEKLFLWAAPGETVDEIRLQAMIRSGHLGDSWAFFDSVLSGDTGEALRQWESVRTTEPVPRALWQLQQRAREQLSRGNAASAERLLDLGKRLYSLEFSIKTGQIPSGQDTLALDALVVASGVFGSARRKNTGNTKRRKA